MGSSILFIPRVIVQEINIVGVYGLLKNARTVKVNGSYMYVADAGWGTKILDISDTSNPIFKVTINVSSNDIFIKGNTLFICGSAGFKIYNITNPLVPTLIGSCSLANTNPQDVFVNGNYAFVADYTAGCQIIDITTPYSPAIIYTYNSGALSCNSIYAVGNYLYVGENASIKILDITVPSSPIFRVLSLSGTCFGIKVVGNFLYSAHYINCKRLQNNQYFEPYFAFIS
ncbi:MAG: hypothetical protein IPF54_22130 [Draconibacterium sp.]|nr:hypothetical protein [Draconibacterium sp.]